MSNKEWDKISYNQSEQAALEKVQKAYRELLDERPIENINYQPVPKENQMKEFKIFVVDRDCREIRTTYIKEFQDKEEAKTWCKEHSRIGKDYFFEELK